MSEERLKEIADGADMIIKGYAFTRSDGIIRILDLSNGESAMTILPDGTMVETNMDEIEQVIVRNIWSLNSKYMEA